jgi:hypothetical protein
MPGMLRKSTAFVPRYRKFESISLQRRVHKLSVPVFAPGALKKPFPRPEHLRALPKTDRKAETPERARKLDPTRPRAGWKHRRARAGEKTSHLLSIAADSGTRPSRQAEFADRGTIENMERAARSALRVDRGNDPARLRASAAAHPRGRKRIVGRAGSRPAWRACRRIAEEGGDGSAAWQVGRVDRAMLRDRKFASLRWRETDSNFGFPVRSTLCMRHETRFRSRTCACTLRDLVSRDSQSRCRKSD